MKNKINQNVGATETKTASLEATPKPAEPSNGKEADRRRYRTMQLAAAKGEVKIDDLQNSEAKDFKNYRRAFSHTARTTLVEDFQKITESFGNNRTFELANSTTLQSRNSESPFAKAGYRVADPSKPDDLAKQRIGKYLVTHLLKSEDEVVYLSTGTTVYQAALALVNSDKPNLRVILTDNLAVVYLFCQKTAVNDGLRRVKLEILGGEAEWDSVDIRMEPVISERRAKLSRWECSTAVISATRVNSETGQIFSIRQPQMKERFLKEMTLPQVIIPVVPSKIGESGGMLIHGPNKPHEFSETSGRESRRYRIVTTKLEKRMSDQLKEHGYEVIEIDRVEGSRSFDT